MVTPTRRRTGPPPGGPPSLDLVLPPFVVTRERRTDAPASMLNDDEASAIAAAVPSRRVEFATVRACAREALGELGLARSAQLGTSFGSVSVLPGERGAPVWPEGVVGSMTHCAGYRAAAVAWASDCRSVGIDAEPNVDLPSDVVGLVAGERERTHLRRLSHSDAGVHWDRVLFSAKESIYKCWFPVTRQWLGFEHVEVALDPDRGVFTGHLLDSGLRASSGIDGWRGRFTVDAGLILTAVVVPPGPGG